MEIEYIIKNPISRELYFTTVQGEKEDIKDLCEHLESLDVVKKNVRPQKRWGCEYENR